MTNSIPVLHLSHTDIEKDSRILKEMRAVAADPAYKVHGLGISMDTGGKSSNLDSDISVAALTVYSRRLRSLPNPVRHLMALVEFSIPMLYKSLKIKPSIVHCHDTFVLPIALLVSLLTGAKLVYDAHELESQKNGLSKFLSKVTLLIEKIAWPRISGVISVSPSILEWYDRELGHKESALVLNSPFFVKDSIDSNEKYPEGYFNRAYNIADGSLVFIYVGLLEAGRGIDILLDAFMAGGIQSHIIFLGYGALSDQISEASGKCDRVHIHEAVPHEDVVAVVKNADIGLCVIENISLSDFYCLPNKLFEYVFAGVPVLASNFPDIKVLINEYELGVCSDVDQKSILSAIKLLEINKPSRITTDVSNLAWDAQATRLLHLYKGLSLNP